MIKNSFIILSISAAFFAHAQDVSVIRNTTEIYSGNSMPGSSKFNAMAGSMGALGGDISSINVNPAGLGVFITGDIGATLSIKNYNNTSTFAGKSNTYEKNVTDLGQIGGVAVFEVAGNSPWKFVNLGVNYANKSLDNYVETAPNSAISFSNGSTTDPQSLTYAGHAYSRTGNQSKLNIALGGNYDNRFYLGGSLNFHGASLFQYDSAKFTYSKDNTTSVFDKQFTPFSEEATGFSASVGVIGKMNQILRVGASLETPTWWSLNRVYNYYADPVDGDGTAQEDRRLTSPMKGTVSAAIVPNKNFAINVDYTVGLSKPSYKVLGGAETELNNFFAKNYKNESELRLGAEFRMDGLRLRGGYAMASNPFNTMSINSYSDAGVGGNTSYNDLILNKKTTYGLGLGYDFKSFYVDLAYQNIKSDYSNPFLAGYELDPNNLGYTSGYYGWSDVTVPTYAVSKVKSKVDNIYITLGWKF